MTTDAYHRLFRAAMRIRLVEERIIDLYPSDLIQSPVHLSIGQEGPSVCLCDALQASDPVFGTYRSHALYLAKGGDLAAMFRELCGRLGGPSKGKAGSMHLAAPEVGFMGSSAVVASNLPHAVGAALAAKRRGTGQVCVAAFGDGATEEGVAHESLNFAALHALPVLFFCENNDLAVHSRRAARQSYDLCGWAAGYGIDTVRIAESWDFVATRATLAETIARIRETGRPAFVEILTYRYKEHVGPGEDFGAGYRGRDEAAWWQARDPLIADAALAAGFAPGIAAEIDAALADALAAPLPERDDLLTDVL
ncbi:putative pyruvate dehydrogenase E1 component, alpha subunit [uncultured Alphaproteobacteria bacterium]|uniref:Putative pyruvate dehydrogenase E1 component, alpha subunit n=1 Tax=uncultured Alphaproteobacteria bacterium TaxID=91750 RepID=A0A212JPY5_9PROT|nr:putative pyruvate dehydrogenase E1 component, alpha subunit [uncultured Alphaproteobacteria bacterium]